MLSDTERSGKPYLLRATERTRIQTEQMVVGDFIRQLRNERGVTQRELAKLLGVSHSAVAQWELGETRPGAQRIIDICAAFGLSSQTFFEPGAPYHGQIVDNGDEMAVLSHFRNLDAAGREVFLRIIRSAAPEIEIPKLARKT